ncbi:MAG: DUF1579 family protein [Planctomycetota bacterium]
MPRTLIQLIAALTITAAGAAAQSDTPEPKPEPAPEPQAEPDTEPSTEPAPATEPLPERTTPPTSPPRVPAGPELSPEMRERLKAAGIDPDDIGRRRTTGTPGLPSSRLPGAGMPSAGMPGPAGAIPSAGAGRPGAPIGLNPPAGATPSGFSPPAPTMTSAPSTPAATAPQPPEAPPITPDEADAVLERLTGTWNLAIRLYDRGKPQPATQGRSVFERTLNDTFIREAFTGVFGGEEVEGLGFTGFDQTRGRFTMSWLDSTSGAITTALGTYDPDSEMLTFAGTYDTTNPPTETRTTITLAQTDRHVFTFKFVQPNGAELTVYEIIYRRAGDP